MKNIEIKEMNAEQRENYLLMSIKNWQKIVMECVISGQFGQKVIDVSVNELRMRLKLLNNIRVMRGKNQITTYMLSYGLT